MEIGSTIWRRRTWEKTQKLKECSGTTRNGPFDRWQKLCEMQRNHYLIPYRLPKQLFFYMLPLNKNVCHVAIVVRKNLKNGIIEAHTLLLLFCILDATFYFINSNHFTSNL
ncbi:uncharacterized protein ACN427_011868 isoform 1-T1 [Glossina fuscipes fuscipes]